MSLRTRALALVLVAGLPAAALGQAPAAPGVPASGAPAQAARHMPGSLALLEQAFRLLEGGDVNAAQRQFESAVAAALEEQNAEVGARAHYGLGKAFLARAEYPAARDHLQRSLPWFEASSDRRGHGIVLKDLAFTCWSLGDRVASRSLYEKAVGQFEAAGDRASWLGSVYSLAFNTPPGAERERLIRQGLDTAAALGDNRRQGLLWHLDADTDYALGHYDGAAEKLARAAGLLEAARARPELARVFTSLGRLYRVHGYPELAADAYRRALRIQDAVGDKQGQIQSLDALASSLRLQGRHREARVRYDEALARARGTGSPELIGRQLGHLASLCNSTGDHRRALLLLEEAGRVRPLATSDHADLSLAYLGLGRADEALAAANVAVKSAEADAVRERLPAALSTRARVEAQMGRRAEALLDLDAALDVIEGFRRRLVPTDFMRRGFSEQHQKLVSFTVEVLYDAGEHERAMEVAERGRGRAFLDLLATRHAERTERSGAEERDSSAAGSGSKRAGDLASIVAVPSSSAAEARAAAERLGSTLVAYWVDADAVYAWVVRAGQPIHGMRTRVPESQLRRLVATMVPASAPGRGALAATVAPGATAAATTAAKTPWRRLHDLLIRPIRRWLPAAPGSRLTLVPHGPLLSLPFAALLDEHGRYLVERHTLHAVPAAAVLDVASRPSPVAPDAPSYLLVADPVAPPRLPTGAELPRLPGTRDEVAAIAKQAPRGAATLLVGADAREEAVRALAKGKTVVHFATHGVVRDDDPFESFLALSQHDRLTAREVYDLPLQASLVVLSGCRTARGRISGDGIVGLTRGFFYAGTPSVVASMWDVADRPTQLLMTRFYRGLRQRQDKDEALRAAQLWLLGALRRGVVQVKTPLGAVTLPEHPVFWAGFVLQGEP